LDKSAKGLQNGLTVLCIVYCIVWCVLRYTSTQVHRCDAGAI